MTVPAAIPHAQDRDVRIRAGRVALVGGCLVFAGKLLAWSFTGSSAVFSDAAESLVNIVAGALLLYSLSVAARPADRDHPYGHGKVEFFTAGVEGTLIAVAAVLILIQAVRQLAVGVELHSLDAGLVLVTAMGAVNGGLAAYLVRTGRRTHSLALVADGQHLWTDVVTSAGVVVGLTLVWLTGFVLLDPLVAIAVALHILWTGWRLLRSAVGGLMDEADEELLAGIAEALDAARKPWWIDIHSLRAFRSGAVQHVDLHLAVPRYFDADRLHKIDTDVHRVIQEASGMPGDVIVHFDPCRPRQCPTCTVEACPVRAAPFQRRRPLTLDRVVRADERLDTGEPLEPGAHG